MCRSFDNLNLLSGEFVATVQQLVDLPFLGRCVGRGIPLRERPDGNDSVVRSEKNRGVHAGALQRAGAHRQLKGNGDDPNIQAEL